MSRRRPIGLAVLGLVALLAALAVSFVMRPFFYFERVGKAMLRSAGLARRTLDTPRGPLVYWAGGRGPLVVLLHGANDQAGAWAQVAGPLAASHRLVVPDLPGHGESAPASGPLSVSDLVAAVERLVEAEGGSAPVTIVGNSLGGWLSLVHAWRHPGRTAHVVLINGAAVRAKPGVEISLLPKSREEARRATDALTDPAGPPVPGFVLDDIVRRAVGSPLARMLEAPVDPDLLLDERLEEVRTPVTLLWGESDRYMPVAYAESVAKRLASARLQTVKACGHVPQRECAARLLPLLVQALGQPPQP